MGTGKSPSGPSNRNNKRPAAPATPDPKKQPDILFQKYFKSAGSRTYAAQVKRASTGNHYLALTCGRRDEKDELRKSIILVFSEDFVQFFRLLQDTAQFIKANPVPEEIRKKRAAYWARQAKQSPPEP